MNKTSSTSTILFVLSMLCALILTQAAASSAAPDEVDAVPKVYWSDKEGSRIWRANLDGSQQEPVSEYLTRPQALTLNSEGQMFIVLDENMIEMLDLKGTRETILDGHPWLSRPNTLAINNDRNTLYWTDGDKPALGQIDLGSEAIQYQLPLGPDEAKGLAVDEANSTMYWPRRGRLYRANLDGSDMTFFPDISGATDVALDLSAGKVYFATSTYGFYSYSIRRINLDGSDEEMLASYEDGRSDGIALDLARGKLYWAERSKTPRIWRANLDGTEAEIIIEKSIFGPFGLAVDAIEGKLYWADWLNQKIQRANLDGSAVEDLLRTLPARPRYLALDTESRQMYWTGDRGAQVWQADLDGRNKQPLIPGTTGSTTGGIARHNGYLYWVDAENETVMRAKQDGTGAEKIIYRRLWDPQGLVLDEASGKMYWADREQDQILRANLDGSGIEVLVDQKLDTPTALALDLLHGKLIWADPIARQIGRANLDGSKVEILLAQGDGLLRPNLVALDVSAGKMYWTDYGRHSLRRANLDGSEIEELIAGDIQLPSGLALHIPPLKIQRSYIPISSG
jgi:low density lipoprotein receptor-related protein 5/6